MEAVAVWRRRKYLGLERAKVGLREAALQVGIGHHDEPVKPHRGGGRSAPDVRWAGRSGWSRRRFFGLPLLTVWSGNGVVWCGASLCGSSEERETRRVGGPAGERPFAGSKQRKGEENDGEAEAG